MKNVTFMNGVFLLCVAYMFVNKPTYHVGFIFGLLAVIFHYRAVQADKKD